MRQQQMVTADKWSDSDSKIILNFEHTIGRQAGIRLSLIKRMETIDDDEKRELYNEYCKQLRTKLTGSGIRFFGNIPSFE